MDSQLSVKAVPFMGDELMAAKDDKTGKIYAGVSYICKGIGLTESQKDTQVQKIQKDIVLCKGSKNLPLKFQGQVRNIQCIDNEFIPLWLAKISITPAIKKEHPEVADKLVQYQLKAQKVLADAFLHPEKESPETIESAKRIRAEAMLLNAKTRAFKTVKAIKDNPQLSDVAAELYGLSTLENLLGAKLGHAPEVGKLYTASEIANSIGHGCTAQKVGRAAKANNLQTDEFGIWALDKSPYSAKQVNSFRYNDRGKAKLKALFSA